MRSIAGRFSLNLQFSILKFDLFFISYCKLFNWKLIKLHTDFVGGIIELTDFVLLAIHLAVSEIEYFGGIWRYRCTCSSPTVPLIISIPFESQVCFMLHFRAVLISSSITLKRYFVIHTR